ncbi:hypothetical protein [Tateyamaria sp. ANG-S1]|uniref:hypothetical protein n=1 Tax=Tateyamaria sp. ANG-S1 TaxID=1577905 RepID=UPI00057D704E|nr:hypothetical protein [Tateyamaria sp. ANG-S1]KIC49593.1 hypothetical protein RA29_07920 [Tateyamaria sp. ANG-S1]
MTMMRSADDLTFRNRFEAGQVAPDDFNHRAHLRLAYVYLCEGAVDTAMPRMRTALHSFLKRNNVPADKYHETLTRSWLLAVQYFMDKAAAARSFNSFIAQDDRLLDTGIMLSHYRKDTLFSDAARAGFVAPDLQPIPPAA